MVTGRVRCLLWPTTGHWRRDVVLLRPQRLHRVELGGAAGGQADTHRHQLGEYRVAPRGVHRQGGRGEGERDDLPEGESRHAANRGEEGSLAEKEQHDAVPGSARCTEGGLFGKYS